VNLEPVRRVLHHDEFLASRVPFAPPRTKADRSIPSPSEGFAPLRMETDIREATGVVTGNTDDCEGTTPGWGQQGHAGVVGREAGGFHKGCCTAANITTTGMMRHGDATNTPFLPEFEAILARPGA